MTDTPNIVRHQHGGESLDRNRHHGRPRHTVARALPVRRLALLLACLTGSAAPAQQAAPAAIVLQRFPAAEASQGVAVDARFAYAVGNNVIGKYDKASGRRVARWEGDRALYPHINSCTVDGAELVCAASNFPGVPMANTVETFDRATMTHRSSRPLPPLGGSLTWIERRGADWWAGVANYDGHGGEPGRDHRFTMVVRLDPAFQRVAAYRLPDALLDRFAPMSMSGGAWGADGLLYVIGHDKRELYAMRLPEAGATLTLVATIAIASDGQAIAWDRGRPRTLWSIGRATGELIASEVPPVR